MTTTPMRQVRPATAENRRIALTILDQIPSMTKAEVGVRDLLILDGGVQMTVGSRHRIRKVRVRLNAHDTYDVVAYRFRRAHGLDVETVYEASDVYADALGPVLRAIVDGA